MICQCEYYFMLFGWTLRQKKNLSEDSAIKLLPNGYDCNHNHNWNFMVHLNNYGHSVPLPVLLSISSFKLLFMKNIQKYQTFINLSRYTAMNNIHYGPTTLQIQHDSAYLVSGLQRLIQMPLEIALGSDSPSSFNVLSLTFKPVRQNPFLEEESSAHHFEACEVESVIFKLKRNSHCYLM